jgi:hypothetical protein
MEVANTLAYYDMATITDAKFLIVHEPLVLIGSSLARLSGKWMELTNTLAYYDTVTINAAKSFIIHNPLVFIFIASIPNQFVGKRSSYGWCGFEQKWERKSKTFLGKKY